MIGDTYTDPMTGNMKVFIKPKKYTPDEEFDDGDESKHQREVSEETEEQRAEAIRAYRKKIGIR